MTDPTDLDITLAKIGWNRSELARRLEIDTSTVDTWARRNRLDRRVAAWLEKLAAYHAKYPAPPDWGPLRPGPVPRSKTTGG